MSATRHARLTDPRTSGLAAEQRSRTVSHKARLYAALESLGQGTYEEIAAEARLQPWEATRRISDLLEDGTILVVGQQKLSSGRLGQLYAIREETVR